MSNFGYLALGVAIGAGALYGWHCYVRPLPAPDCGCGGGDEAKLDEAAAAISEAPEGDADLDEVERLVRGQDGVA